MNTHTRLLHETAETVLAILTCNKAYDHHDRLHAALMADRTAGGADGPQDASPVSNESLRAEWSDTQLDLAAAAILDSWSDHKEHWSRVAARKVLAIAAEKIAAARKVNSTVILERDAARLRVADLEAANGRAAIAAARLA